jgi:hypothetical protein
MNPCFYEDVPLLKITTEEQSLYVQASRYRGLLLLVANRVLNNSDDAESAVKASSPVVIRPTEPGSGVATEGLPRLGIPTKPSAIPEGYSSTSCRIRATKSPRVCYTEYFVTQNAEHPIRMRVFYNPFPIPQTAKRVSVQCGDAYQAVLLTTTALVRVGFAGRWSLWK